MLDETTVGRELKALGFAKISARPRRRGLKRWSWSASRNAARWSPINRPTMSPISRASTRPAGRWHRPTWPVPARSRRRISSPHRARSATPSNPGADTPPSSIKAEFDAQAGDHHASWRSAYDRPQLSDPVENVWRLMRDNWLSNPDLQILRRHRRLCCQAWNNLIPTGRSCPSAWQMPAHVLINDRWSARSITTSAPEDSPTTASN